MNDAQSVFVVFDLVEANLWLLTPRQFGCRVAQKYFQSDELYMFAYSLFSALSKGPKASAHRVLDEIAQRKYFLAVYDLVLQRAHRGVPVDVMSEVLTDFIKAVRKLYSGNRAQRNHRALDENDRININTHPSPPQQLVFGAAPSPPPTPIKVIQADPHSPIPAPAPAPEPEEPLFPANIKFSFGKDSTQPTDILAAVLKNDVYMTPPQATEELMDLHVAYRRQSSYIE